MKRFLRQTVQRATGTGAFSALVGVMERLGDRRQNLLRVLTYHRVDDPRRPIGLDPSLISATPDAFGRQMEFLARRCRVVSLEDVLSALAGRATLPPRAVLITFDDAYQDFAEHAHPILQRYEMPVALFVPTGFPDQPDRAFWWDQLYVAVVANPARLTSLECGGRRLNLSNADDRGRTFAWLKSHLKTLPHADAMALVRRLATDLSAPPAENAVLTWDELRSLHRQGVTLAPHTRTHPLLNRLPLDEAWAEALGSLADLRREIGAAPPALAYPSGAFNAAVAAMLSSSGVQAAFTTRRGVNVLGATDPYLMCRVNVGQRTPLALLRAQLLPAMRLLNPPMERASI